MRYNKIINKKVVSLEIIKGDLNILDSKGFLLYSNFSRFERQEIVGKLKRKELNFFLSVKVIFHKKVIYDYEEFFSTDNYKELLEILIVYFENLEQFEVCKSLTSCINKI